MYAKIINNSKINVIPYFIFGIISILYGLAIYYLLPLAMFSFKLTLIIDIFFLILLGLIFGLTLLASNLQRVFQIMLIHVIFFWERNSMKRLLDNNLKAHTMRNRTTGLIYSLALAFLIFLMV